MGFTILKFINFLTILSQYDSLETIQKTANKIPPQTFLTQQDALKYISLFVGLTMAGIELVKYLIQKYNENSRERREDERQDKIYREIFTRENTFKSDFKGTIESYQEMIQTTTSTMNNLINTINSNDRIQDESSTMIINQIENIVRMIETQQNNIDKRYQEIISKLDSQKENYIIFNTNFKSVEENLRNIKDVFEKRNNFEKEMIRNNEKMTRLFAKQLGDTQTSVNNIVTKFSQSTNQIIRMLASNERINESKKILDNISKEDKEKEK